MKHIHDSQPLPSNQAFTIGNERFPSNWLVNATAEQLAERGITVAPEPPPHPTESKKFYYITKNGDDYVVTPKPLEMLKRTMVSGAKRAASGMLNGSDWMVVKQAETGVGVLPQWTEWRAAIREESNRIEAEVGAATDIAGLKAIKPAWPLDPDFIAEKARLEEARLEDEDEEGDA